MKRTQWAVVSALWAAGLFGGPIQPTPPTPERVTLEMDRPDRSDILRDVPEPATLTVVGVGLLLLGLLRRQQEPPER